MNESELFGATLTGFGLLAVGWIWLVVLAWRHSRPWGLAVGLVPPLGLLFAVGRLRSVRMPLILGVLGLLLAVGPPLVNRLLPVDLGPRDVLVEGERHLTLTGWDRLEYGLLRDRSDAVVLQMANPDVTDETLRLLAGMTRLRELDLNNSAVTDSGLALLATLPALERLRLANTAITDRGLRDHLMRMPSLAELDLRGTSVSAETLSEWRTAKPGRRVLR